MTLAGQLAAGVIAAVRAVPFGTLHGMLAGLVAGIIGTLVEVIARTTSGCVTALTIVEGRPCGRPPTVEYIVPYLEIALTVGLTGAAIGAAITTAVRQLCLGAAPEYRKLELLRRRTGRLILVARIVATDRCSKNRPEATLVVRPAVARRACSAAMIVTTCGNPDGASGMIEASITWSPSIPWTRPR